MYLAKKTMPQGLGYSMVTRQLLGYYMLIISLITLESDLQGERRTGDNIYSIRTQAL